MVYTRTEHLVITQCTLSPPLLDRLRRASKSMLTTGKMEQGGASLRGEALEPGRSSRVDSKRIRRWQLGCGSGDLCVIKPVPAPTLSLSRQVEDTKGWLCASTSQGFPELQVGTCMSCLLHMHFMQLHSPVTKKAATMVVHRSVPV